MTPSGYTLLQRQPISRQTPDSSLEKTGVLLPQYDKATNCNGFPSRLILGFPQLTRDEYLFSSEFRRHLRLYFRSNDRPPLLIRYGRLNTASTPR